MQHRGVTVGVWVTNAWGCVAEQTLFGSGVLLDPLVGHVKIAASGLWDHTSGRCSGGGSTALVAFNIVLGNCCLLALPSPLCPRVC